MPPSDPLALRILGADTGAVVGQSGRHASGPRVRTFIAVRHRFAEDTLFGAVKQGAQQVVILGAGLDTWPYRNPIQNCLRVFEVDHPATQTWKHQLLRNAAIPGPSSLIYAPVDFERQNLADGLANAGFHSTGETFFLWLGVVPYLTGEAVWSTLGFIAHLRGGAHVVFDYSGPPESLPPSVRAEHETRAVRVAALGEAWLTYSSPGELHPRLTVLGFSTIEDLGPRQIAARYFPHSGGPVPETGGHIPRAATVRSGSAAHRKQGFA